MVVVHRDKPTMAPPPSAINALHPSRNLGNVSDMKLELSTGSYSARAAAKKLMTAPKPPAPKRSAAPRRDSPARSRTALPTPNISYAQMDDDYVEEELPPPPPRRRDLWNSSPQRKVEYFKPQRMAPSSSAPALPPAQPLGVVFSPEKAAAAEPPATPRATATIGDSMVVERTDMQKLMVQLRDLKEQHALDLEALQAARKELGDKEALLVRLSQLAVREAPRSKAIRDLVASSVPTALVVAPWKGVPNRHRRWGQD